MGSCNLLENSFIKLGTDITYNEEVHAFASSITEEGQQQQKEFIDTGLIGCKKGISDTIRKNNIVTPAKSAVQKDPEKTPTLTGFDFNKIKNGNIILSCLLCRDFSNRNDQSV